jgi:hypothetical protein
MVAAIPETRVYLKFEEFWNWCHADNGLVCRNVDAIIALEAILFSVAWTEAGWQPTYPRRAMAVLYV